MNKSILIATVVVGSIVTTACETPGGARPGTAMSVQYGVVQSVQEVQAEANTGGGAALGGLTGLAVAAGTGGSRNQQLAGAAGGALLGGLIANQRAANQQLKQHTIRLNNGASVAVVTDHHNITVGDCVAVEQGRHANIRRVSSVMCNDLADTSRPAYTTTHQANVREAEECEQAKREVLNAQTEEAINLAHMRMRALCEN
jgi:outer membrane lipoprotein SlyB